MYDAADNPLRIDTEASADAAAVEALVLAAFGPGRFAKTAERLRERSRIAAGFVARDDQGVVGAVRMWDIRIGDQPALFLGPIAVSVACRKAGVGADLIRMCQAYAESKGLGVLLVGDPPYFGRFGFNGAPEARLPGPVDQRRVMWSGRSAAVGFVRAP